MEGCRGRGNDRRPDLAAVSVAVPHPRELRRGAALRDVRSGAGPCPSARAGHTVRLALPMVAAIGSGYRAGVERRRALGPAGRRIHDRIGGRASCPSDTVVWVNTPSRVYHYAGTHYYGHTKRGAFMCEAERASGRKSRGAQGAPDPFGMTGASAARTPARAAFSAMKESRRQRGLLRAGLRQRQRQLCGSIIAPSPQRLVSGRRGQADGRRPKRGDRARSCDVRAMSTGCACSLSGHATSTPIPIHLQFIVISINGCSTLNR